MAWASGLRSSPAEALPPRPSVLGPLRMLTASGALAPRRLCLWAAVRGRLGRAGREASESVHLVPFPVPAGPRAGGRLHLSVTWVPVNMYVCMCVFAVVNTCPWCWGSYRSDC